MGEWADGKYRRDGLAADGGLMRIEEYQLQDGSVTTSKIYNGAVTAAKLAAEAVTSEKIEDGAVTAAKLADGAGVAALLTAGLGTSQIVSYADAGDSPITLVAAGDERAGLVIAICTESLAGGTPPTFAVGIEDGSGDEFFSAAALAGASAGDIFVSAGILTASKDLQIAVTGGDDDPAGAFAFTVLALPTGA